MGPLAQAAIDAEAAEAGEGVAAPIERTAENLFKS